MFSAWVKVKSPNGDESWQLGSKKLIEWEKSGNFTSFCIILRKDDKRKGDIALGIDSYSTSYSWEKVGEYIGGNVAAGDDYKIRVRGYLANGSKIDDSDNDFTITDKPKQRYQIGKRKFSQPNVKKYQIGRTRKEKMITPTVLKTYILKNPKIVSGWRIKAHGDVRYKVCKFYRNKNDGDPDPGIIRVGWSEYKHGEDSYCENFYRSWVYFNLNAVPKDGILEEAKLIYNKLQGACRAEAMIFVLNQKRKKNGSLYGVKGYYTDPEDFRKVVQK